MWLPHSLEGSDQLVQVGGDVAHGELRWADDVFEAERNANVQLVMLIHVCCHVRLNSLPPNAKWQKWKKKNPKTNIKAHKSTG